MSFSKHLPCFELLIDIFPSNQSGQNNLFYWKQQNTVSTLLETGTHKISFT